MNSLAAIVRKSLNGLYELCTGRSEYVPLNEEHYRQRILVMTSMFWFLCVLFLTVIVPLIVPLRPEGRVAAELLFLATGTGVLASMMILRTWGNRIFAMNVLLVIISVSFAAACFAFGGTRSPTYHLMIMAPVLAGIVGSTPLVIGWSIAVVAFWTGVLVAERSGVEFLQIIAPANHAMAMTMGYIASSIAIISVMIIYAEMNKALRESLKDSNNELAHLSSHDQLTLLPNRRFYEERIPLALQRAADQSSMVGLLIIDLNGFKKINDTYGHAVGDLVLQQIAQRLLGATRTSDTVSRFSGDEFVVILRDTDLVLAEQAARRLVDEIGRPMDDPADLRLSVSVGMATTGDSDIGADNLLRQADAAMYQAKSAGGNGYCVFTEELRDRVSRSNEIERELPFAADRDEFHLVFQPFLSLASDDEAMVAVEALIRWTHPKIGAVGPLEFIPLAERNGAIDEIGAWVLQQVCEHLAAWQALLEPDTPFVVYTNLSPAQLHDGLLDLVDACLASTGADPARLGFEITETAVLEDGDESVVALLCALRDRGCHIALDDFGTGYSSLSRLRATPLDLLKVDGSFVNERTADGREHAILAAVSALAREMEIDVLAEGVETADQLAFVRALGFDLAQGYGIARPAPADEVVNWLPVPSAPVLAELQRRPARW